MPTKLDPETYDANADQQHAPEQESLGIHPERAEAEAADLENNFNAPSAPEADYGKTPSSGQVKAGEEAAATGQNSSGVEDNESDKVGSGFKKEKGGKLKRARSKVRSLRSRKFLLIAGGTMGGSLVAALIFLLLLASSLKIPNLAQHIVTYEFARATRQFAAQANRVSGQTLAVQATDNKVYSGLKQRWQGLRSNTWGKLDKYRPGQVIDNLKSTQNLETTYTTTTGLLPREVLTSIKLNGVEYPISQQGLSRYIPFAKDVFQFKNGVTFSKNFTPALTAGIRANDIGPVIRGSVAKSIRKQLGIGLVAWRLGEFKGKSPTEAQIEEVRQRVALIDKNTGALDNTKARPKTSNLAEAVDESRAATKAALASDEAIAAAIKNGGYLQSAQDAVGNALKKTGLETGLSFINPVYGVAVPMCIVYDGSVESSGPVIDQQSAQQQATFYYIASAADEQKKGTLNNEESTELATAVSATNTNLGDISSSNPEIRARAGSVDTSNTISAQAGAGGGYTLLNVLLGNATANTLNGVADKLCGAITNPYFAGAAGLVSIAAAFASLGTSAVAEEAVGVAATGVITKTTAGLAERLVTKYIGASSGRVAGLVTDVGKSTVKNAVGVAAATIVAKLIVSGYAGQQNSGFAQGTALADNASAGGDLAAQEIERQQLFGAPMTAADIAKSDQADQVAINLNNQSKSFYQRYFATSNADSLINHMASTVSANFNSSFFRTLVDMGGSIMTPMKSAVSLMNSLGSKATAGPADSHNGNVQIGWTEAEETLIDSSSTYLPAENQEILDGSGKAGEIADTYATCFGYKYSGDPTASMDPTDPNSALQPDTEEGTMGYLLSHGLLVRNEDGTILNDPNVLCSPINLGPTNSKYGDLVFRWRLSASFGTTFNQLINFQTVTAS